MPLSSSSFSFSDVRAVRIRHARVADRKTSLSTAVTHPTPSSPPSVSPGGGYEPGDLPQFPGLTSRRASSPLHRLCPFVAPLNLGTPG
jgi:hypothetical protein